MPQPSQLDDLFARPLRGEASVWPSDWHNEATLGPAKRRLFFHGISGLLLARIEHLIDWPDALLETMRNEAVARAMWEMRHRVLLTEMLKELSDRSIASAFLKGTALAYALYQKPEHRHRGDTDLLICKMDLAASREVLAGLGWRRVGHAPGIFGPLHDQETWRYSDKAGLTHDIDLHWEVTPLRALKTVFNVETILSASVPLQHLSPLARTAEPITRLMHGCINRALHARSGYFSLDRNEYDPCRLIWAYDTRLEADSLSHSEWDEFARRSTKLGVAAICNDALRFSQKVMGMEVPQNASNRLANAPRSTHAVRVIEHAGSFYSALADFRATSGVAQKILYVLARTFPSGGHMRGKYPDAQRWPIVMLYLRRQFEALGQLVKGGAR